jgi:hypothetical protein
MSTLDPIIRTIRPFAITGCAWLRTQCAEPSGHTTRYSQRNGSPSRARSRAA